MGIGKQAKIMSKRQVDVFLTFLGTQRNGLRNQVVLLLSVKAGLRAKEISFLTWQMVLTSEGKISKVIHLTNDASKGNSGRQIPMNRLLSQHLEDLLEKSKAGPRFSPLDRVISTERSNATSPQVIVNMFQSWYRELGFVGCSSHSGRRTFITNAARNISLAGGSLRDVQALAGHSNLQTTQRYIEFDSSAQQKIVDLI